MEAYKRGSLGPAFAGQGDWVASSGNVTDEAWVEYIKNQTPPEPDDNVRATYVRRRRTIQL